MQHKPGKPDPFLRLLLYMTAVILRSPFGGALLNSARWLDGQIQGKERANWLEINQFRIFLPRLDPAFAAYRLAQISDFHIGTWADRTSLLEAVAHLNRLKPDLVVITGDFVTHNPRHYADDLVAILESIQARDGRLAVLGNHDHWADPFKVRKILAKAGLVELNNRVFSIQRGPARLQIAGVDDIMEKLDDLPAVLAQLPGQEAAILLAHEPDFADQSASSGRFDLQLSGHTHGGQVNFPIVGPLVLPKFGRKYPSGYYRVGKMQLYTNRGLGTAELEIRFRCPAEITLFELHPGNAAIQRIDRF